MLFSRVFCFNFRPFEDNDLAYSDYSSDEEGSGRLKRIKPQATKAETTPLVRHFFETVFHGEMSNIKKSKKGCKKCGPCKRPDCSSCSQCRKMKKFGGSIEDHLLQCDARQCIKSEIRIEGLSESPSKKHKKPK